MNFEITSSLTATERDEWRRLIEKSGLTPDALAERILLVYDDDELIATGSRDGCVLKHIAVADSHRGEDLTARVLTELRRDAFEDGHTHLFLYTKPENRYTFESLLFFPIAETESVLVMENVREGLKQYLDSLPSPTEGVSGALVMNCNPFTLGHKALIEHAAAECDRVYVFVLSEDKSEFSEEERFEMVRLGTAHLDNVTVLKTGPYLISSATFPTYFIKNRDKAAHAACEVDIEIFGRYLAKRLNVTRRYVGEEPFSHLTKEYNEALKRSLQKYGVELCEIKRISDEDCTPISASAVREYIKKGDTDAALRLVPQTSASYVKEKIAKGI